MTERRLLSTTFLLVMTAVGGLVGAMIGAMFEAQVAHRSAPTVRIVDTNSKTLHLTPDPGSLTADQESALHRYGTIKVVDPDGCPREVGSFTLPDSEGITLIIKRHKSPD